MKKNAPPDLNQSPKQLPQVDRSVFAAKLWNPPPPEIAPTEAIANTESPQPLRLQLIGIINEGEPGQYKAALYDIDNDRLLIVAGGDEIRDQRVTHVNEHGLELSDGRSSRRLLLKQEPS